MKIKIISIMPHEPGYEVVENEERPYCNWNTPSGQWVGVWGCDWMDLLGYEVLKITDQFDIEVWQPDVRADKIYTCYTDRGLKHKLYPAVHKRRLFGLKVRKDVISHVLIRDLLQVVKNDRTIIHFYDYSPYNVRLARLLGTRPYIISYLGEIQVPAIQLLSPCRNFPAKINVFFDHLAFIRYINGAEYITYSNDISIDWLKKAFKGKLRKLTMGCDFSFWRPVHKMQVRQKLALSQQQTIFFTSACLRDIKQIDKMILALERVGQNYDYLYIIAGHGTAEYVQHLHKLSNTLAFNGRVKFTGFVGDELLRDYYNACDYFILPSMQEGASVSIMKALACSVPVISTNVGGTAELMTQYNAGCLLDNGDYASWSEILKSILNKTRKVTSLDRDVARKNYDWLEVAGKFLRIYEELAQRYYGKDGVSTLRKGKHDR